jgi:predicted membrane protein
VLFYLFAKRENLIGPMVTGWKRFVETVAPLPIGKWWHAASALVVIALLVWLVVRNG